MRQKGENRRKAGRYKKKIICPKCKKITAVDLKNLLCERCNNKIAIKAIYPEKEEK